MKKFLIGLAAVLFIFAVLTAVYLASGAVFYLGLRILNVGVTYGQAVALALLIATAGLLFRGGSAVKSMKGGD